MPSKRKATKTAEAPRTAEVTDPGDDVPSLMGLMASSGFTAKADPATRSSTSGSGSKFKRKETGGEA